MDWERIPLVVRWREKGSCVSARDAVVGALIVPVKACARQTDESARWWGDCRFDKLNASSQSSCPSPVLGHPLDEVGLRHVRRREDRLVPPAPLTAHEAQLLQQGVRSLSRPLPTAAIPLRLLGPQLGNEVESLLPAVFRREGVLKKLHGGWTCLIDDLTSDRIEVACADLKHS